MPGITHYKATRGNIEGYSAGDEWVTAKQYRRFVDGLFLYPAYRDEWPARYGWTPGFPCAPYGSFGTIPEEALYRSNYEAMREAFNEINADVETGSSDTFEILATDTHALALACLFEHQFEEYPVLDEDYMSEMESELTDEAYKSYGREDLIREFIRHPELDWIFDEDTLEIRNDQEDLRDIVDPMLRGIGRSVVAYSGEMYFGEDSLRYALDELVGAIMESPRLGLPELVHQFSGLIRYDKAVKDEETHERTQPRIQGIQIPKREDA